MYLRASESLPSGLGKLVLRADVFAQSYFYYTNLAASLPHPLDANTKIGGYGLLNARVEWNDIAGSRIHVAGWVKNALNREYEVGGLGLGAVVGTDAVILGTPRMFGAEVGVKF
jgi:iron complex outermembrane receptor protein